MVYCEHEVFDVRCNGEPCPWEYDSERHTLTIGARRKLQPTATTYTVSFESS